MSKLNEFDMDSFFTLFFLHNKIESPKHRVWHRCIHWKSEDGGYEAIACRRCGLFRLQREHGEPFDRYLTPFFMEELLSRDSFALRWHVKGYSKNAENYPPYMPNFSIHRAEMMKENTPMVRTYFLYERRGSSC